MQYIFLYALFLTTKTGYSYSIVPSQDIIINNRIIELHNHEECSHKYKFLYHILHSYSRPFTMLELGAKQGYFSIRAAYDFQKSVFVMIENNVRQYSQNIDLLDICMLNTKLDNIILLNKEISANDIQRLSECEHFDLVVAFDFFSSKLKHWQQIIQYLLDLADNAIVEVPDNMPDLTDYLKSKDSYHIASLENSTIMFSEGQKKLLLRRHWLRPLSSSLSVESTYTLKKLIKQYNHVVITDWLPGINLVTFKMMGGSYPTAETLAAKITELKNVPHHDWLAHNMIVQGSHATMIDCNDPRYTNENLEAPEKKERMLAKILDWLYLESPTDAAKFFKVKHMEYR